MKRFIYSFLLIILLFIVILFTYLSTIGIETTKFNNIIVKEIKKKAPSTQLLLSKIKIKFDIKKIQIYLSASKPEIIYQGIKIPITEISVYLKLSSIVKSKTKINQVIVSLVNFKIEDVQKLAIRTKPSNLKTYLLNNLNKGKIKKISIDVKLDKNLNIKEYKANGSIKKINIKIFDDLLIEDISLNFISNKDLTIINSIRANYNGISVTNGSIRLKKNKEIEIDGKLNTQFNLNENTINKLFAKLNIKVSNKNKVSTQGSLLHNFTLKINKNFKLIEYNYKSSGNITETKIFLKNYFKSSFIKKSIKKILISKTNVQIDLNKKNKSLLTLEGLYSLGGLENKKFKVTYDLNKKNPKYLIDFDLAENISFKIINFKTNYKNVSNIKAEFKTINNNLVFNYIKFSEKRSSIFINGLKLNSKNEIESISSIDVLTFNNNEENNNFKINLKKKISIIGKKYDATYLLKQLSSKGNTNLLQNFTKDIEIKLDSLVTKSQVPLRKFNLIGSIKKGKFERLFAKSEFSKTEFLDVSLKKDENNKKVLEIYSDLPQALLADYKFFEGIKGGKLLYSSIFSENGSTSKVTIENFKVIKAPAFAKLLTLADLGGIADLLSGKGMSFDILEINMSEDDNVRTIDEILALGPSVSVLMDGYIEKKGGLTSLSGTLVPAKSLNSMISKIPVVGKILVGNKAGEGIFGVSFKMKGLPKEIKTTVNPIKTLTPRFITRAVEKMKKDN